MNCKMCVEQLMDYHFQEISGGERQEIAAHLSQCPGCAMAYCQLHGDLTALAIERLESPQPQVFARLKARVEQEFHPSWWRRLLNLASAPVPAYGASLAVALVVVVWVFFAGGAPPGLEPDSEVTAVAPGLLSVVETESESVAPVPIFQNYDAVGLIAIDPTNL